MGLALVAFIAALGAVTSLAGVLWSLLPRRRVGGLTFCRVGALSFSYCLTRKARSCASKVSRSSDGRLIYTEAIQGQEIELIEVTL